MIIVWSGLGWLVPLIGCVSAGVTLGLVAAFFADPTSLSGHDWPRVLCLWGAAVPQWFLGKLLNDDGPPEHTLFFIRIEYWAPILFVAGLASPFFK